MDLTSPLETFAIGAKSALARSTLQSGLVCPFKARDAGSALLAPTPWGQGLSPRLNFVVSSVTMERHRSIPHSSSGPTPDPVAIVSSGEARS